MKFLGKMARFVREAKDELDKVAWPSRQTTMRYTVIVVIASVVTGAVTGGIDYALSVIVEQFIS